MTEFSITQNMRISGCSALVFSKNGKYIVTGSTDNLVEIYDK
jgi:WD40 repeat protein